MGQKRLLRGLRKKKKGRLSKRDSMNTDGDKKKKKNKLGVNRESEEASLFGKKCYTEEQEQCQGS